LTLESHVLQPWEYVNSNLAKDLIFILQVIKFAQFYVLYYNSIIVQSHFLSHLERALRMTTSNSTPNVQELSLDGSTAPTQLVNPTAAYFAGEYVKCMRDIYVAALVCSVNAVTIGGPGWGKTDMMESLLKYSLPGDSMVLDVEPSMQKEDVRGTKDLELLLTKSLVKDKIDDTAYDPRWLAIGANEIFRANEMVMGNFIYLLERKDMPKPPPVLGNANFLPDDKAAEAVMSRIGLWHWVTVDSCDVRAVAEAQLRGMGQGLILPGKLPSKDEILFARNAIPGERAIKAVLDVVDSVGQEMLSAGRTVDPRRTRHWTRVIYRYSAWLTGQEDFTSVPNEAHQILRFANLSKTEDEYTDWSLTITSMVDRVGAALEVIMSNAFSAFEAFSQDRSQLVAAGSALGKAQDELKALGTNDPRVAQMEAQIVSWFAAASRGQKPVR
jgi:hypothetical protein